MRRMDLRHILAGHIPVSGREAVSPVDVLMLLVVNLSIAQDPLYELEQWVESLDLRAVGYRHPPLVRFTDDRFARALDKLYESDRASLLTRIVVRAVKAFDVQLNQIHSDSTTVKAFGRIPGRTRTGLELHHGHSTDHRPDLKQLVFNLSISRDGAVPVYHKVYPGNRNDETTHIETWETLCRLHGAADFLYVADCKLCTQKQLAHIVGRGGRAITSMPENWTEARRFKMALRAAPQPKKVIWRRPLPSDESAAEYVSLFDDICRTDHGGYPLYWFTSSEKRHRDRRGRHERLQRAEAALGELSPKVNTRRLKKKSRIQRVAAAILRKYHVEPFFDLRIITHREHVRSRYRGRPGTFPRYRIRYRDTYSLHWSRDLMALRRETRTDGVFPLLCTDPAIPPKNVLQAYKYQPRLEKRFEQFKSIHRAAPLLFKKIQRVEANMFVFFMALLVQALLERCIRQQLDQRRSPPLKLYPEDREALHPTTSQILKTFDGLSTYAITENGRQVEEYRDAINDTHREVLALLDISETDYWKVT